MYKKPQDIISDILKEDISVDIQEPSIGINFIEPEDKTGIDIRNNKSINLKPQISVDVINNNERTTKFEMNIRKALNGDLLIFDHTDIDIVLMVEKKKIIAFPKDLMSEVVYGAESRLMEWMRKNGVIEYDSIQGGNVYGSLEGKIHESKERDSEGEGIHQSFPLQCEESSHGSKSN